MVWSVIRALFTLIPWLMRMYEEGRLKKQTQDELIAAIGRRWNERVELARIAKEKGELPREDLDFNNRRNRDDHLSVG